MATLPLPTAAGSRYREGRLLPSSALPSVAHRGAALRAGSLLRSGRRTARVGPAVTTSTANAASTAAIAARSASPSASLTAMTIAAREFPQQPCVYLPPPRCPTVKLDRRPTVPPPRACLDAARLRRALATTARARDGDGVGPTVTTSTAAAASAVAIAARHRRGTRSGNPQDTPGNGVTVRASDGIGADNWSAEIAETRGHSRLGPEPRCHAN